MDSIRAPLRKSLESHLIRAYLNFVPPRVAPNFVLLLPAKYQFSEAAGYEEFCSAFDLEYGQGRLEEAGHFYETACRLGHPLANYCYGLWFLVGDRPSTDKDLKKAFQKFCLAHKAGLGVATYQLADFYRTGKGKVVGRDAEKCFGFLLQSVLDPRVHWLLDSAPFCLLGLAYGLGRGPAAASMSDAARCLDRAVRYSLYLQQCGKSTAAASDGQYSYLYQLCMLVIQLDSEEARKRVSVRLDAMERYMDTLPPAHAMMTQLDFALVARKFGLDYDDYLAGLSGGKEGKRVTWKSFRRLATGRARPLYAYEMQSLVEPWAPIEPDEPELQKYLADIEARYGSIGRHDDIAQEADYAFQLYANDLEAGRSGEEESGNMATGNSGFEGEASGDGDYEANTGEQTRDGAEVTVI